MQKKVLLPILLAGPVALPAFADINLDFPNVQDWTCPNTAFSESFKVGDSKTEVNAQVGTGIIYSQQISGYPAGSYKLVFSSISNAKVSIIINGETLEFEADESKVYPFTLGNNETFQIAVSAANAAQAFTFTGVNIVLEFDVEKAQDAVSAVLKDLRAYCPTIEKVNEEDTGEYFAQGDTLRKKRAELVDIYYDGASSEYMMVVYPDGSEISANDLYFLLENNQNNSEELLKIYSKYGYDQTPSYPVAYFKEILKNANQLEEDIKAENVAFANYQTNLTNYNGFKKYYEDLTTSIAAQQTQLDASKGKGLSEDLYNKYSGELSAISESVSTWWSTIKDAYTMPILENEGIWRGSKIDTEGYEETLAQLKEDLQELSENIGAADENWKIYYQVNFVDLPELRNAYDALVKYLEDVEGVKDYEDNFEDYVEKIGAQALEKYNEARDKIIPEIEGAVDYNEDNQCQTTIQAATEWLKNQLTETTETVEGQNEQMTAALEALSGYESSLEEIEDSIVVPDAYQDEWNKLVQAVNDAIGELKEYDEEHYKALELDTEAADYTKLTDAVEEALKNLQQYADDHDFAALKDIQDRLDEAWGQVQKDYPTFVKQLEEVKDDIQDAINKLNPTSESLDTEIEGIEGRIDDMLVDAKTLQDLQNSLNEAGDTINEKYDEWVQKKVSGDIDNLQAAIHDLDPASETFEEEVKNISDRIGQMLDAAKELAEASVGINAALTDAQEMIDGFNSLVSEKQIQSYVGYDKSVFKALNDYIKANQGGGNPAISDAITAISKYRDDFNQYQDLPGQDCLDKLRELLTQIEKDPNLSVDLTDAELEFEKGGTDINYTTVKGQIDAIDITGYAEYAGYDGIAKSLKEINSKLTEIKSNIGAPTNTIADYQKADDALADLLGAILTLKADIQKVVANKAAYDDQTAQLAKLENWLEKLQEYNNDYSLVPALDTFNEKIAELREELDALQEDIDGYYNDLESATEAETINKDIEEFDQSVLDTYKQCRDNNNAYNGQLTKSTNVNAEISGLIQTIDKMLEDMEEESSVTQLLNDWRTELQNLLTKSEDPLNWSAVNTKAFTYYGEGNSAEKNEEIIEYYEALSAAAQEISNKLNGETYQNAVNDANADMTHEWESTVTDMTNAYLEGITDFNWFFYIPGLTNEGWKDFVEEKGIEQSHKVLFQYYDRINDLNKTVVDWKAAQNAEQHVITSEEWKVYTDRAAEILSEINTLIESLVSGMNSAAVEYYDQLSSEVSKAIGEAETTLEAQGIPTSPYMDAINSDYQEAKDMYTTAMANTPDASQDSDVEGSQESVSPMDQVGGKMDEIANLLDSCLPPYKYQEWAQTQWGTEYEAAQGTISGLRDDIDEINKNGFVDDSYYKSQMEKFESIVKEIGELNETVKAINPLIDEFGGYSDKLEELLGQLETIKDNIQSNSDNNVAEQEAYKDFQTALTEKLYPGFDDLNAFALSLAGAANKTIGEEINGPVDPEPGQFGGIKGAIESLEAAVEEAKGNLLDWNPTVEELVEGILTSIESEYEKVAKAETSYLMNFYGTTVKEAFNNAYEYIEGLGENEKPAVPKGYESWTEYFNAMNKKINDFEAQLGDAGTWGFAYTYEGREKWGDDSVEMEQELCEIYVSLQSVWTDNPAEEVRNALDEQKDEIQSQLDEAVAALKGYEYLKVQDEEAYNKFAGKYADIQTALDKEAGSWASEEEGDWVVARDAFHQIALMFLGIDIENISAEAAQAEEAAKAEADKNAAVDNRYAELEQQYNDLLQ